MSDVIIRVRVEGGQATSEIDRLRGQLASLDRQTGANSAGLGRMAQASSGAAGGMGLLTKAAGAFGIAFTGAQLLSKAAELEQLGEASLRAERALVAVAGGAQAAEAATEAVQRATGGAVTEMIAQQQASRLLSLGIATNNEELEKFARLATTLGATVSKGATESIEQLSLTIANLSYERLDALGISAGRVRERVAELKREGMTTEDAFRFATLEIGSQKLEALERQGFQTATNLDRLRVKAEDAAAALGEKLAGAADTAAGALLRIGFQNEQFSDDDISKGYALLADAVLKYGDALDETTAKAAEGLAEFRNAATLNALTDAIRANGEQTYVLRDAFLAAAEAKGISEMQALQLFEAITNLISVEQMLSDELIDTKNAAIGADIALAQTGQTVAVLRAEAAATILQVRILKDELDAVAARQAGLVRRATDPRAFREARDNEFGTRSGLAGIYEDEHRKAFNLDQQQRMYQRWEREALEATRAVSGGFRSVGSSAVDAAEDARRAWEEELRGLEGMVNQTLSFNTSVGQFDSLLDEFGLRNQNASDEYVRQLADIRNRALEGERSPWLDFFPELDSADSREIAARAEAAIRAAQSGMDFGRLDRSKVKQDVRELILANRNRDQFVRDLAEELQAEFSQQEIQMALGQTLGVSFTGAGEVASEELVDTLQAGVAAGIRSSAGEFESAGRDLMKALISGAKSAAEDNGIVATLRKVITEDVLKLLIEQGQG